MRSMEKTTGGADANRLMPTGSSADTDSATRQTEIMTVQCHLEAVKRADSDRLVKHYDGSSGGSAMSPRRCTGRCRTSPATRPVTVRSGRPTATTPMRRRAKTPTCVSVRRESGSCTATATPRSRPVGTFGKRIGSARSGPSGGTRPRGGGRATTLEVSSTPEGRDAKQKILDGMVTNSRRQVGYCLYINFLRKIDEGNDQDKVAQAVQARDTRRGSV